MSKFYIQEGPGMTTGQNWYQVYIDGRMTGNPMPTREEAEGYIKLLEQREAEAEAETERQRKKNRSGPSFGM